MLAPMNLCRRLPIFGGPRRGATELVRSDGSKGLVGQLGSAFWFNLMSAPAARYAIERTKRTILKEIRQ